MLLLSVFALSIIAFTSTNVDGLLVLIGFSSDPSLLRRDITAGYAFAIAGLVAASLTIAATSLILPTNVIGLLGFFPIGIGLRKLWNSTAKRRSVDARDAASAVVLGNRQRGIMTIVVISITNGGDNIATYTPFFATQTAWETVITIVIFTIMTLLWCRLAFSLVRHPVFRTPLRRWGNVGLSYLLIILGATILCRSGLLDFIVYEPAWKLTP